MQVMVHRRMRQLSLTETETFVNLAKHALETLAASDDERADVREATNSDQDDDNTSAGAPGYQPSPAHAMKPIQSEPVFKRRGKKSLGRILAGTTEEEAAAMMEMHMHEERRGSSDAGDDDCLQFVARSSSDVRLNDDLSNDEADETTRLATATAQNLLLC